MRKHIDRASWARASLYAAPIIVLALALFYYWFAVADRYIIFLYYHNMGPLAPDTSPFSAETSGRYWMAGLVASGAVLVLYTAANWLLARLVRSYCAPDWWRVWALVAPLLAVGILAIAMTTNQPTLPFSNAAQVAAATLAGLALALLPGCVAVERPRDLFWLALEGAALMLILTFGAKLDELGRWLARGRAIYVIMIGLGLVGGAAGLSAAVRLHWRRRKAAPGFVEVLCAGAIVSYLVLPLLHHLEISLLEGYGYITSASNFFASSVGWQLVAWLVGAGVAWGALKVWRGRPAPG